MAYCYGGQSNIDEPIEFYQDLRFFLLAFSVDTLEKLAKNQLADLKPHLQKYITWMRHRVEQYNDGQLLNSNRNWRDLLRDENYKTLVRKRLLKSSFQGEFFIQVSENLMKVLNGNLDPLNLLFDGDLAKQYYQDIASTARYIVPTTRYLDLLAHKNPRMKILEVDAGTGTMIGHVLQALKGKSKELDTLRFDRYDYTDLSRSFFHEAQEAYKNFTDRINYRVLDIEHDPISQGFEEETYDLIVAASVSIRPIHIYRIELKV